MANVIVAASTPLKWKLFAETIKWYQGTEYSHVLIIREWQVYQSNYKGAHKEPVVSFLKENRVVWQMEIDENLVDWDYVEECVSKNIPYGYTQIFAIIVRILFGIIIREGSSARLICSEFVGKALRMKWVNDFTQPEEIVKALTARSK